MASTKALAFSLPLLPPTSGHCSLPLTSLSLPSLAHSFSSSCSTSSFTAHCRRPSITHHSFPLKPSTPLPPSLFPSRSPSPSTQLLCKADDFVFPDPIPEFAEAETEKFSTHLLERLSKRKDIFGDSVEQVVGACTEILSNFLHTEYGGPGTLMVIPFIDMADTLNEKGLPGGPQAARAAVVWAQKHIDDDWDEWTGGTD